MSGGERREGFRFIHISTDEVYGDLPIEDTQTRFKENAPLRPSSPYAASKAASDMFVLSYVRTYGLPAIIARMCNNYGPRQHSEKFIPCMIQCALAGEALPLYGTGENVREWLHVEDACRAIAAIAERGRAGGIYNVSSNDDALQHRGCAGYRAEQCGPTWRRTICRSQRSACRRSLGA